MKALISREVGGPEALTLEDLPDPEARPGHVVVDVKACGVNYPDALIIRDLYQFKPPRPFSPGGEISGIARAQEFGDATTVALVRRALAAYGAAALMMPYGEFARAVDSPGVGLLVDSFHMNIEEDDPCAAIRAAGGMICHVHFADNNR